MTLARLAMTEPNMLEYSVLCKAIDLAWQQDQLNISNCLCVELLCRRVALIEEKYNFRLPQLDQQRAGGYAPENDTSLFLGLGSASLIGKGSVIVMPELSAYIGEELAKESAILKGKVKAQELRDKIRPNPKGEAEAPG